MTRPEPQNVLMENQELSTAGEREHIPAREFKKSGEVGLLQKKYSNNLEQNLDTALGSSTSTPERLMALYLAGKLSQGDLVFKLKEFNHVTADNMIREAKHCPTVPIDYVEVRQASVDPITFEEDKPLQGASGNKSKEDAGKGLQPARDEHTKEQEKENEEELQEQIREEETQQVIQTEEIEQTNRQVVQAHIQAERRRKEEEELEGEVSTSLVDGEGIGERTKKGSLDSAQRRIKGAKRHIEQQKRQELLTLAQTIAREGRSEKEQEEEEDLLMSLLDEWELFADEPSTSELRIAMDEE
jgi:hypothetical protein